MKHSLAQSLPEKSAPSNQSVKPRRPANPADTLNWRARVDKMPDLSGKGRIILARVIIDQRIEGYCCRSQRSTARECGCSTRTVIRTLALLRADGSIRVQARYRTRRRGRTSSAITVNWSHERWKDCQPRSLPPARETQAIAGVAQAGVEVLRDKLAEDSLQRTLKLEVSPPSRKPQVFCKPSANDQSSDQSKNEAKVVESTPITVEPAQIEAFARGARDRHIPIARHDLAFVLLLLMQMKIDARDWLIYVARNHKLEKARDSRALLRHVALRYSIERCAGILRE